MRARENEPHDQGTGDCGWTCRGCKSFGKNYSSKSGENYHRCPCRYLGSTTEGKDAHLEYVELCEKTPDKPTNRVHLNCAVDNLNLWVRPLAMGRVRKPCHLRTQGSTGHDGLAHQKSNLEHGSHVGWYLFPKNILEISEIIFGCRKFGEDTAT